MILASGIEVLSALSTAAPTVHVLVDAQNVFASPAKHRCVTSLISWPNTRLVSLASIMTADASIELLTAKVLDGDDIERGVPMGALGQRCNRKAVDGRRRRSI